MKDFIQFDSYTCTSLLDIPSLLLTNYFLPLLKPFYSCDVFCIEMLDQIVQQYATSHVFTSQLMQQWKTALEQKYSAIPGITEMHDILIVRKVDKITVP